MLVLLLCLGWTDLFEYAPEEPWEPLLYRLEVLQQHPVDLNAATVEDLLAIPLLKITDAFKIVGARSEFGAFRSIADLDRTGLDPATIDALRPYVTVRAKLLDRADLSIRSRATRQLVTPSSNRYYTRLTGRTVEHNACLIMERDPFETSLFDYWRAGLVITDADGPRTFAIGAYDLDFGAGAVLSSQGSFYRGADFRLLASQRGILPRTTVGENDGFWGAAITDSFLLKYSLLYSHRRRDGRIDSLGFARSFDDSGDHSDSSGLAHQRRIREEIAGYNCAWCCAGLTVEQRTIWIDYDPAFACQDSSREFYGSQALVSGLGVRYQEPSLLIFGEAVRAHRGLLGGLFGLAVNLPARVDLTFAGKYFPDGFYSPLGAEAEDNRLRLVVDLSQRSSIVDLGATIEASNRTDLDTAAYDVTGAVMRRLGRADLHLLLDWRFLADQLVSYGSRASINWAVAAGAYLRLRLEDKHERAADSDRGILTAIEAGGSSPRFVGKLGGGWFQTDSYASRVYCYEPDLPGVITNRAHYGSGLFGFVLLGIKLPRRITCYVKYSGADGVTYEHQVGGQVDIKL